MEDKSLPRTLRDDVLAKVEAIKMEAAESIERHDELIRAASSEIARLNTSVAAPDAARLIAEDIRLSISDWRNKIMNKAADAKCLSRHMPLITCSGVNAGGVHSFDEKIPSILNIVPYDAPAVAALAMLMTDEQIDAWAHAQAVAAGCPEHGPTVADLAADHQRLTKKLQALVADRYEACLAMDALIDASLSPLLPDRMPSAQVMFEERIPTVTETLPDGTKRPQQGAVGHSFDELMRIRAADDEEDQFRRIQRGEELSDYHGKALEHLEGENQ